MQNIIRDNNPDYKVEWHQSIIHNYQTVVLYVGKTTYGLQILVCWHYYG